MFLFFSSLYFSKGREIHWELSLLRGSEREIEGADLNGSASVLPSWNGGLSQHTKESAGQKGIFILLSLPSYWRYSLIFFLLILKLNDNPSLSGFHTHRVQTTPTQFRFCLGYDQYRKVCCFVPVDAFCNIRYDKCTVSLSFMEFKWGQCK